MGDLAVWQALGVALAAGLLVGRERERSRHPGDAGVRADEGPSIVRLHEGIAAASYRPRGRHHEIYLGDPRRSAPEKLRTILRQPVEPAFGVAPLPPARSCVPA